MSQVKRRPHEFPPQTQQRMPGAEHEMKPKPKFDNPEYKGSGLLKDKVAIITGGDSGIGRSVAVFFAREVKIETELQITKKGANVTVVYYEQHDDAKETKEMVKKEGKQCLLIAGDVSKKDFCNQVVRQTVDHFGKLDILVHLKGINKQINHAGVQYAEKNFEELSEEQLLKTFQTNVFGYFFMAQEAIKHMNPGSSIVNTSSVNAYKGNAIMVDYSASKVFIHSLLSPQGSKYVLYIFFGFESCKERNSCEW